uniref:Uncharacterized protein n=1 Tax=Strigamia maritima TaxID=126957 RepID=T1J2Y4_STRMM
MAASRSSLLELKEEVACDTQEIILKCDDDSFLAIHEARFTTNASEGLENCILEYDAYEGSLRLPATNDTCTEDIRMPVNYRA